MGADTMARTTLRARGQLTLPEAWFWTPEWQAGEREATEQSRRGEGERFETDAAFLDSLG